MIKQHIILTLALAGSLAITHATEPAFFAMDTGTRDAKHETPEEQVALVQEVGFAGIAPIYRSPEMLRETLDALDRRKLKMSAVYVPLNLDTPDPISPAIRDTIEQMRGRDSVLWLYVNFRDHKPSDPAGDAKALPVMREVADLAKEAGVRVSLYPHKSNWVERVEDGARLARQVGRDNFGVTFNLCHWLMVDGADLDARLRDALPHLQMVTINGADADTVELARVIQPLDSGTFDVGQVLAKLAELRWQGPIGLQHYGIGGDAKVNLQRSMNAWREMSRKVWPASAPKSKLSPGPEPVNGKAMEDPARDARMAWWREARFGMFVHWGLYSGLAGSWNDQMVADKGGLEWIQQRVGADTYSYAAQAVPKFQPKPDFAKAWARLAKEAGCQYVVFTTKHHEGFALHDSMLTQYDAGDLLNRDLVKEICEALHAEVLKVGFYHSVIDWHHPQYDFTRSKKLPYPDGGRQLEVTPRNHQRYIDFLHGQVDELISNYGQVDILWWDYSGTDFQGDEAWKATDLMAKVRAKQPQVIMNNRLFRIPEAGFSGMGTHAVTNRMDPRYGDFVTPEQHIPETGLSGVDWETCMTLNTGWATTSTTKNGKALRKSHAT